MNIKLAKPESFFAEFNEGGSIAVPRKKKAKTVATEFQISVIEV